MLRKTARPAAMNRSALSSLIDAAPICGHALRRTAKAKESGIMISF
jgi:hypothetical protein